MLKVNWKNTTVREGPTARSKGHSSFHLSGGVRASVILRQQKQRLRYSFACVSQHNTRCHSLKLFLYTDADMLIIIWQNIWQESINTILLSDCAALYLPVRRSDERVSSLQCFVVFCRYSKISYKQKTRMKEGCERAFQKVGVKEKY